MTITTRPTLTGRQNRARGSKQAKRGPRWLGDGLQEGPTERVLLRGYVRYGSTAWPSAPSRTQ